MYQRYKESVMAEEQGPEKDPVGLTSDEVLEACKEPDDSTQDFFIQQTMYRIKNPKESLEFYTNVLGMRLLKNVDFAAMKFSMYFVGYEKASDIPTDDAERAEWVFTRRGVISLTHNWGTEDDPKFKGYHNGNSEPKGFGHISVVVPDIEKACERFEELGVNFIKKPSDGSIKDIAFIQDPDGYWIQIISPSLGRAVAQM